MKITKRQLRRIIKEEKTKLVSEGRLDQRRKDRDAMVAQMTFKKLRNKAWDLAGSLQGRLSTGQYESDDYWDREHGQIPMLADIVDAAKIKAAEEGTAFDDPPEIRVNGGIFDYSGDYSLGLPAGVMESKMKITKNQLRRIIKEEKAKLQEQIGGYNLGDDEAYNEAILEFSDKFAALMSEMLRMGMLPEDVEEAINVARTNNSMEMQ